MDEDFPTIDALGKQLMAKGFLAEEQLSEFKRLELSSLVSARKEDAMLLYSRLEDSDPAKMAMRLGLDDLRDWMRRRVASASSSNPPKLIFVSGAPGSGKSALIERLALANPGILVASADDFKARFKAEAGDWLESVPEPAKSNLQKSVYIHRLTALPSWEMVDLALDAGKDMVVEMLGLGAAEDARTLRRALAHGYAVEAYHVGCAVEEALGRAARRHFEDKARGGEGRWIGLSQAAGKQKAILVAFAQLCELMAQTPAKMHLLDNTRMALAEIWNSDSPEAPPVDRFAQWRVDPKLWRPGANPAADLCAFARGQDGVWRVALVERAGEPHKGRWAFPGGFIKGQRSDGVFEWGEEKAQQAALRRFSEETLCQERIDGSWMVGKFDGIERDPRNTQNRWVESWLFCVILDQAEPLAGGDAARSAAWMEVGPALDGELSMAFDHRSMLALAYESARAHFPALNWSLEKAIPAKPSKPSR